jgi:hypothetical protein
MLPGRSLGIGGGERQLISLLLMATHVAGRGFRIEFPLGCKHEMVGVEEPEKERHTIDYPRLAGSFRIDPLFLAFIQKLSLRKRTARTASY